MNSSNNLLKIDVQGSELDLLLGSNEVLSYFRYIFIEISLESLYKNSGDSNKIFEFLRENGFKDIYSYNPLKRKGKILSIDYLFQRTS